MKITNIDTLSALFDRLITERIKWFFFIKDNNEEKVDHQKIVINEIKINMNALIDLLCALSVVFYKGKIL